MVVTKTTKEATVASQEVTRVSPFAEGVLHLSVLPLLNALRTRYNDPSAVIFPTIADRLQAAHRFHEHASTTPKTSQVAEVKSIHARTVPQEDGITTENLEVAFYTHNFPAGVVTAFARRREERTEVEMRIKQVITITPYDEHTDFSQNGRETKAKRSEVGRLTFVEFKNGELRIVRPFLDISGRLTYLAIPAPEMGSTEYQMLQALGQERSGYGESMLESYLRELTLPVPPAA